MTAAILMGSVLLALLWAWGMAYRHDARTGRRADPIGAVFDAWLERPGRPPGPCAAGPDGVSSTPRPSLRDTFTEGDSR